MTENALLKKEVRLDLKAKHLTKKQGQYNKLITKIARKEEAIASLSKIMKAGTKYSHRTITPSSKYVAADNRVDVIISDLHYKGHMDDKPVRKLLKKVMVEIEKNKATKHRLVFLGDDIEGELHLSSLDKSQEQNTVNQVNGVQKLYADFINSVASIIGANKVEVAFVCESNHGQLRLHGMNRGEQPRNDVGYIIKNYLVAATDDKIKF